MCIRDRNQTAIAQQANKIQVKGNVTDMAGEDVYKRQVWTNLCRFALAGVFIFSGFAKAVDPLGSEYKIQDYLCLLYTSRCV